MSKQELIETIESEADFKGLDALKLSEHHYRITDGRKCIDVWPSTGSYRAFGSGGHISGFISKGKIETHDDLSKVTEDLWPTMLK
jgi:hypothetical protein